MIDPHALPKLLARWPRRGARSAKEARRLRRLARGLGVRVSPRVPREQLRQAATNLIQRQAITYSPPPWKYQQSFRPTQNLHQQALKLRPYANVPINFGGYSTTAYVNSIRRIQHQGRSTFVRADLTIDTQNIPLYLERETKCTCVYCGTNPTGDEINCRSCGAPLDSCT